MAAMLFKETTYSLTKLIEDIDLGEIRLPDIQRPFVWKKTQVRDLFDSMYKGFPVGYLLFWENDLPGESRPIGTSNKQRAPRLLIIDGQQRMTALYAVLKGVPVLTKDFRKEKIQIAFRPRDARFEVADAATRRDPEFISDISKLWVDGMTSHRFINSFVERLRSHKDIDEATERDIEDAIDRLYNISNYRFTAVELSSSVSEEEVAEVFVRINSQGTVLKQADFILTLMSVFWDEGRAELERFCQDAREPSKKAGPYNHYVEPDADQLVRVSVALGFRRARLQHVYSILRGKDLEGGNDLEAGLFSPERRDQQFEVLKKAQAYTLDLQHWHDFFKCLLRAGFKSRSMISSENTLFYSYALFLIGKRDFGVPADELRETIARWFFMSQLTSRYAASSDTQMEQDLARIKEASGPSEFQYALDRVIKDTLTEDFWSVALPNQLATSAAISPALYAYYAALVLLDARVLFSKMKVSELLDPALKSRRASLERHHLFPRKYLESIGISRKRDVNQIANYALLEWPDNVAIGAEAPSSYFPRYRDRVSEEDMKLHALPEGWHQMSYFQFLEERRKLMARVIRDGFESLSGFSDLPGGVAQEVRYSDEASWSRSGESNPGPVHYE